MSETRTIIRLVEQNMSGTFSGELNKVQAIINGLVAVFVLLRCVLILSHARGEEQPIGATLNQCKKIILAGVIAVFLPDYISIITGNGYFGGTQQLSELGNQVCALARTSADLVIGLTAALTVWSVIKEGMAWQAAADEGKPSHCEKIKKALIIGVVIVTGSGILSVIFGYLAVPVDKL